MEKKDIEKLVNIRTRLIEDYSKLRDYRDNKNAIMREFDHAQYLHSLIKEVDGILKNHVKFAD